MTITDLLISVVISAVTGVAASYFVWWVSVTRFVPRIKFADKIARTKTGENPSGLRYRIKFENCGRRNIIDIEVIIRVRITGLRAALPENNEVVYLSTSSLEYKKVAILRPVRNNNKRAILEVKAYDCNYFEKSIFPHTIQSLAREKKVTLDDVFSINDNVDLQVIILGYDSFSGVRKYFESKFYKREDIQLGVFDKESLEFIPNQDETEANSGFVSVRGDE